MISCQEIGPLTWIYLHLFREGLNNSESKFAVLDYPLA